MLDRGPLSDANVIKTLRTFVCIRPLTYENKAESDYLRKVFAPRGFLENTVFAIMDPQAKTYLARPGRGADTLYGDPDDRNFSLTKSLEAVAKPYKAVARQSTLPMSGDLRYGLNVAACDDRPLALVVDSGEGDKSLRTKLGSLAWTDEFWGSFTYAEAKLQDLKIIDGSVGKTGILFVQPDEYGARGRSLGFVDAGATETEMAKAMREALARFKPRGETDHRQHLMNGVKKGIRWRSAIPCEDQQAVQATKRLWGG